MKALQKKLARREKSELIAMIQQMLCQEPDLQWLLMTPLPTTSLPKVFLDSEVYQQQVLVAMAVGDQLRKYKRHEVQRRLLAIKTLADAFAQQQQYDESIDLDEDIPSLLIENTTQQEREAIAGWIRDALSTNKEAKWGGVSLRQHYETLLAKLVQEKYHYD